MIGSRARSDPAANRSVTYHWATGPTQRKRVCPVWQGVKPALSWNSGTGFLDLDCQLGMMFSASGDFAIAWDCPALASTISGAPLGEVRRKTSGTTFSRAEVSPSLHCRSRSVTGLVVASKRRTPGAKLDWKASVVFVESQETARGLHIVGTRCFLHGVAGL